MTHLQRCLRSRKGSCQLTAVVLAHGRNREGNHERGDNDKHNDQGVCPDHPTHAAELCLVREPVPVQLVSVLRLRTAIRCERLSRPTSPAAALSRRSRAS
jgi:hypothetical protein